MSIVILILTHRNIYMVNMGSIYRLARVVSTNSRTLPITIHSQEIKFQRGITSGGGVTRRVLPSEIEAPNFARASRS